MKCVFSFEFFVLVVVILYQRVLDIESQPDGCC